MSCDPHIACLAVVCATGCFYTTPINSQPSAEIELQTTGVIQKGDQVTLSARKSTDPNDAFSDLSLHWTAVKCTSPMSCTVFQEEVDVEPFRFYVPGHETVQVELIVTDRQGAWNRSQLMIEPVNRIPVVKVSVDGRHNATGGYTIGRELTIHADGNDGMDDDPLTYAFSYFPPTASQPSAVTWERVDENSYRLVPDVAGMWQVEVVANDMIDSSQAATRAFQIDEDLPPCIAATSPDTVEGTGVARYVLRRADPPRRFAVLSVADDLDPYPFPQGNDDPLLAQAKFRWSVTPPDGALAPVPGYDLADYWFDPAAYAPGAIATLRVDVSDRVLRPSPCTDDAPFCPTTGTCRQRLSWEVEVR